MRWASSAKRVSLKSPHSRVFELKVTDHSFLTPRAMEAAKDVARGTATAYWPKRLNAPCFSKPIHVCSQLNCISTLCTKAHVSSVTTRHGTLLPLTAFSAQCAALTTKSLHSTRVQVLIACIYAENFLLEALCSSVQASARRPACAQAW